MHVVSIRGGMHGEEKKKKKEEEEMLMKKKKKPAGDDADASTVLVSTTYNTLPELHVGGSKPWAK
jgi:hypothetical protein